MTADATKCVIESASLASSRILPTHLDSTDSVIIWIANPWCMVLFIIHSTMARASYEFVHDASSYAVRRS